MEKFIASTLLGTIGVVDGGLLATRALDKMQMSDLSSASLVIVTAAVVSGLVLVALLHAATPILSLATEKAV